MANALFTAYKVNLIEADDDIIAGDVKLVFVDHADDTPAPTTDDFLDDIAAGARVATSGNFASKTATSGTFDAADVTVSTVTGDQFESIVIYIDSGAAATSALCVFIDTATGLPCTPNGGNITVAWHASGIYSL
jgi:hypothetical protein